MGSLLGSEATKISEQRVGRSSDTRTAVADPIAGREVYVADSIARREVCVQQRVSDWAVGESGAGSSGIRGRRGLC